MATLSKKHFGVIVVCLLFSILWGTSDAIRGNAWVDFRALYAGANCLIHQHNPYDAVALEHEYQSEGGQRPPNDLRYLLAVTININLPTTSLLVAPIAVLPWSLAHIVWMALTVGIFCLAIFAIWQLGARYSLELSTVLVCVLALNCKSIFSSGNAAGIVVGLCVLAVWCFLENRYVWVGIVCLALSLAIKPHDTGFVWLYFLLIGGVQRRRAMQSFLIAGAIGVAAVLWISTVAPHWAHDLRANLAAVEAPGGIDEPGLTSPLGSSAPGVIDLQAIVSVFRNDPAFYNAVSYLICGSMLLIWMIRTLRAPRSVTETWFALATVPALTMLLTYHRPWDAKLAMLAIPACSMLWAKGSALGKGAFLVTAAGLGFTGDFTLAILSQIYRQIHPTTIGISGQILIVLLIRSASLALLAMCIFYLWVYCSRKTVNEEMTTRQDVGMNSRQVAS